MWKISAFSGFAVEEFNFEFFIPLLRQQIEIDAAIFKGGMEFKASGADDKRLVFVKCGIKDHIAVGGECKFFSEIALSRGRFFVAEKSFKSHRGIGSDLETFQIEAGGICDSGAVFPFFDKFGIRNDVFAAAAPDCKGFCRGESFKVAVFEIGADGGKSINKDRIFIGSSESNIDDSAFEWCKGQLKFFPVICRGEYTGFLQQFSLGFCAL